MHRHRFAQICYTLYVYTHQYRALARIPVTSASNNAVTSVTEGSPKWEDLLVVQNDDDSGP